MGRDEDDDRPEEQDAVDEDVTEAEEDGAPLPPPTVDTTLGFEGSIEGL